MTNTKKFNVYEMVADRFLQIMELGVIPWQCPWTADAYSYQTGKTYSLLNQILLINPDEIEKNLDEKGEISLEALEKLLESVAGAWLTWNQIKRLGGRVKKDEKSRQICFYAKYDKPTGEKDENGEPITESRFALKYYNVWHINQTEGIEDKTHTAKTSADAETVINTYTTAENIKTTFGGAKAFYNPETDTVTLPNMADFKTTAEYYSTYFHELTHSTGHSTRLDRIKKVAAFGSDDYGKEELVAEIGAAALVNTCGLETTKSFKNSAAYLQNWMQAIKANPKMVVTACGQAQKAVDYILNL